MMPFKSKVLIVLFIFSLILMSNVQARSIRFLNSDSSFLETVTGAIGGAFSLVFGLLSAAVDFLFGLKDSIFSRRRSYEYNYD